MTSGRSSRRHFDAPRAGMLAPRRQVDREDVMAAKKKAATAGAAVWSLKESPAIRRLVEDEELRDNIQQAYLSARDAYGRLSNGKSATKQVFDDKKFQRDVSKAATSFRDVSV